MPTNYIEAYDSMRERFESTWTDWVTNGKPVNIRNSAGPRQPVIELKRADNQNVYVPQIFWKESEEDQPPGYEEHWCRFTSQEIETNQAALRTGLEAGELVQSKETSYGIIIVQMFYAKAAFRGEHRKLSVIARDIFRSRNIRGNKVWYRNARINELRPEENYYRANIVAEYEFDELV